MQPSRLLVNNVVHSCYLFSHTLFRCARCLNDNLPIAGELLGYPPYVFAVFFFSDRREILHDISPGQVFSPFGALLPEAHQIRTFGPKFWPFDRKYLENGIGRSVTPSQRELSKNVNHEAVAPRGVNYKQKYVPSIGKGGAGVAHSFKCTPFLRMAGWCLADALVF